MQTFVRILMVCCLAIVSESGPAKNVLQKKAPTEAYYWRDYYGEIPHDALPGGKDKHGSPIYIGQVIHDKEVLLPAKIYVGKKQAFYEYAHNEVVVEILIKIFATERPEDFEWIETTSEEIFSLERKHDLIIGGHEADYKSIYIGRHEVEGELLVGKVLVGSTEFTGLHVTKDGKSIHCKTFEVLAYNPKYYKEESASFKEYKEYNATHHEDYKGKIINIHIE